jgi:hypothetical protein
MIGYGSLTIQDYQALFSGIGSLTLNQSQQASVSFAGSGDFVVTGSSNSGFAMFPALQGFGGVLSSYGAASSLFPALESYAEGGLYVPTITNFGYVTFPHLVSSGIIHTISYLDGDGNLPAMVAKGGEGEYGEGDVTFPTLVSLGIYDATPNERKLYTFAYTLSAFGIRPSYIVVLDSTGQIVDTISGNLAYIAELLESIESSGTFSVIGLFLASLDANLTSLDTTLATTGTSVLDNTARVWVVNIDTEATSQYDNYGYNSFYTYEGKNYGVAADGIYELTGTTDNGTNIDAQVDFGRSDLGSFYKKRVTSAYLGLNSSGKLSLTVEADGVTQTFVMKDSSTTTTRQRVNMGSGLSGYYWNFILKNNGYSFDLENVMFEIMQLNRRI